MNKMFNYIINNTYRIHKKYLNDYTNKIII